MTRAAINKLKKENKNDISNLGFRRYTLQKYYNSADTSTPEAKSISVTIDNMTAFINALYEYENKLTEIIKTK